MLNYDFQNLLSAYEFECFSRDLLNAHEDLSLSSFAEGRDGGIDLRYSKGYHTIIVQAKRFKNYIQLKSTLKKEVNKVKKLNPSRYIITTSVDLSPNNKKEIVDIFKPFIIKESDIIAKQDLNRLLSLHPDIERKYYKLWLCSTNILEEVLHKDIFNWTRFEIIKIQETVKTYVMNESFDDALAKLLHNKYVVISGEPGIGKTTLARMMILYLFSDKFKGQKVPFKKYLFEWESYDEFYYSNSSINDFAGVFQEGKRQIFFFDDFLGQITLEEGEKNFASRLITFIRTCQKYTDKLFILTTREYILQEGLIRYPNLNIGNGIEYSKSVIDMGKYTRFVRAQILYNHLDANNIPQAYINNILKNKNYFKIVDHPHFSPRIIEAFLGENIHEKCNPENYFNIFLASFDYPDKVWLDAFHGFARELQEALLVLTTLQTPIRLTEWKLAFSYYYCRTHKHDSFISDHEWNELIKILLNNFIKIDYEQNLSRILVVDYHNPGVREVLQKYVRNDDTLLIHLLNNSFFIDQVFNVIKSYNSSLIPDKLIDPIANAIDRCWESFNRCYDDSKYSGLTRVDVLMVIEKLCNKVLLSRPKFIENKISEKLFLDKESQSMDCQLFLLEHSPSNSYLPISDVLFENYKKIIESTNDCLLFVKIVVKFFPNNIDFIKTEDFYKIVILCFDKEIYQSDYSIDGLAEKAHILSKFVPLLQNDILFSDLEKIKDALNYANSRKVHYLKTKKNYYLDKQEETNIIKMFSLFKN